ncbi:MAG: hypothetical protein KF899_10395, partial [Parvibaculum sp.]|nr:hypothetical protein [Parvibaculum sp.]
MKPIPDDDFDARPAPRPGVRRTPDARFEGIDDFPWPPRYHEVEPGLCENHLPAGAEVTKAPPKSCSISLPPA